MGSGFPTFLPGDPRIHRRIRHRPRGSSARHRAHGHGHRRGARRHRAPCRVDGSRSRGHGVRPSEPALLRRADELEGQTHAHRVVRRRASARKRHRVLRDAPRGGGNGGVPAGAWLLGGSVPRGALAGRAHREPEAVHRRRRARHGGDQRLRHGDRQVERALCDPQQHAQESGSVLPGGRPRRSRRGSVGMSAALVRQGYLHVPLLHRLADRERQSDRRAGAGGACGAGQASECDDRLLPHDRMPAQVHARLLRRRRAGRSVRELLSPTWCAGRRARK